MNKLTFEILRIANMDRLPTFKNAKGELAHAEVDGSDWSLGDWSNALVGEVGEAANIIKKLRRGDFMLDDVVTFKEKEGPTTPRKELAKEFADVQIYLDLIAFNAGIDLGEATVEKFNEVSRRVGSNVFIVG